METESRGSFVDAAKDFLYPEPDRWCFPVCFTCGEYSPFMIYLGNNEKSIKFQPQAERIQLFCAICAPDPDHFRKHFHGEQLFRADSILNDRKFLNLLTKYVYSNPYYELYSNVDRIIITENTQLCAAYKTVAKRTVPMSFKMKLLMNLFPAAHRLPNKKYTSPEDLCEGMREKYHEICVSYMNLSEAGGSQLLDNFDILIDRTPLGERQVSRRTVPFREIKPIDEPLGHNLTGSSVVNDDSDREIRAVNDSDDELASVASGGARRRANVASSTSGSSTSIVTDFQMSSSEGASGQSILPSSQSQMLPSQSTEIYSSVDISSQSVVAQPEAEITIGDDSGSGSSDSEDSRPSIHFWRRPSTRSSSTANDSQEAGPSNVKRRRISPRRAEIPMNPTPDQVREHPLGRLPRVDGG